MGKVQKKKLQQPLPLKPQNTLPWLISRHGKQAKIVMKIDPEVIRKLIACIIKADWRPRSTH